MKYKLISTKEADKLTKEVNELLNDGWELYGSPSSCISRNSHGVQVGNHIQALVK